MISTLIQQFETVSAIEPNTANEPLLRNELNILLIRAHGLYSRRNPGKADSEALQRIVQGCHKRLRALQNHILCDNPPASMKLCGLKDLLDNLAGACDLVLSETGRRLIFLEPGEEMYLVCSPSQMTSLALNLVSNACLHTPAKKVYLKLSPSGGGALVEVACSGYLNLANLRAANNRKGCGLMAMNAVAAAHKGSLLFCNNGGNACAAFYLPFAQDSLSIAPTQYETYEPPDFVELLCDRLSPVYTGLCDVCRCPV